MDAQKLRKILRKAQNNLKSQPFSILNEAGCQNILGSDNSIKCYSCDNVRRQNYELKHTLCQLQEKQIKMDETQKQLAAIKELYQLKCQQVQLLRRELNQQKNKINNMQNITNNFCQSSIDSITKKMKQIQIGSTRHLHN